MKNKLPGLTISIPLFFNKDESIDYETLSRYIKELSTQKYISAIYSMAYNTRYRMLSEDEVLELNKHILKLADSLKLTCYVGHPYIFNRKSLEKYLKEISNYNPAGISMLYPERYYNIDEPILEFLKMPAKFGLKTVLHEMKLVSGFNGELVNWPKSLLRKAIELNSVTGVKEDSKDDEITKFVLDECKKNSVACILAGGGKERALRFIDDGLNTWLNGSTMFYPKAIDIIYPAMIKKDLKIVKFYIEKIEKPFFANCVKKYGWHIAHKAALEFFGYGSRFERFPHAFLPQKEYESLLEIFTNIKKALESIDKI